MDSGDTDNSWKLYAGGEINKMWAVELAYNDLGSFRQADVTSWSLAGVAKWPLHHAQEIGYKELSASRRGRQRRAHQQLGA